MYGGAGSRKCFRWNALPLAAIGLLKLQGSGGSDSYNFVYSQIPSGESSDSVRTIPIQRATQQNCGARSRVEFHFQTVIVLLLTASVVAMLARRLRFPYSVGLVAAGIVLAGLPFAPQIPLTKDLIFTALLPPLLFEAAYCIEWNALRTNSPVILILVTVGVAMSAFVTSVGVHYLIHWPWITAAAFGALIAATDPVSVVSVLRDANVHNRFRLLLEGESLLNDGTAAVAFGLVIGMAPGSPWAIPLIAARTVGGGILCGGAIAFATLLLAGRTEDHLVEITLTTVAAYGSFVAADRFGFSGVLATITAGLVMANAQPFNAISQYGRVAVRSFWEYAAFIANSLVFLLIGLHEATQHFYTIWLPALLSVVLVLLGRAAAIYPCCFAFSRSSLRVSFKDQHLLFWGGMRGALALALALGLPVNLPHREEVVSVSFAVVSFSIFVQGLSIVPLLRGMKGPSA